jgi:predicted nucleic acid-binding protein
VTELVDTSVLILALRDENVREWLRAAVVADAVAICDQVAGEYLRGARNQTEFDDFEAVLAAFPWFRIEPADWDRVRSVYRSLSGVTGGYQQSVPIPDALIAAVAERHEVAVVHYDEDYDRIAAITGQPVRWVVPRGSAA